MFLSRAWKLGTKYGSIQFRNPILQLVACQWSRMWNYGGPAYRILWGKDLKTIIWLKCYNYNNNIQLNSSSNNFYELQLSVRFPGKCFQLNGQNRFTKNERMSNRLYLYRSDSRCHSNNSSVLWNCIKLVVSEILLFCCGCEKKKSQKIQQYVLNWI